MSWTLILGLESRCSPIVASTVFATIALYTCAVPLLYMALLFKARKALKAGERGPLADALSFLLTVLVEGGGAGGAEGGGDEGEGGEGEPALWLPCVRMLRRLAAVHTSVVSEGIDGFIEGLEASGGAEDARAADATKRLCAAAAGGAW